MENGATKFYLATQNCYFGRTVKGVEARVQSQGHCRVAHCFWFTSHVSVRSELQLADALALLNEGRVALNSLFIDILVICECVAAGLTDTMGRKNIFLELGITHNLRRRS